MMEKREIFATKFYLRIFKWFLKYWEKLFLVIMLMSAVVLFSSILYSLGIVGLQNTDLQENSALNFIEPLIWTLLSYVFIAAFIAIIVMEFFRYFYKVFLKKEFIIPFKKTAKYGGVSLSALLALSLLTNIIKFGLGEYLLAFLGIYFAGIISMILWIKVSKAIDKINSLALNNDIYKTKEELEKKN